MQLSTNFPRGLSPVTHIDQHPAPLPTNVSKEADAAFMVELKRTDEPRYKRLIENMQRAAYRHAAKEAA